MNRPGPGVLARSVLTALAALLVVGWVHSTAPPATLVAAGAEDLEKFAVVDMSAAIDRVAGTSATGDLAK
jgi:hypothetical protein